MPPCFHASIPVCIPVSIPVFHRMSVVVAYSMSDDAFIFPITPSSPMAEACEAWAVNGIKNMFGSPLNVQQLQSEAGAAGAMHGSATTGGLK